MSKNSQISMSVIKKKEKIIPEEDDSVRNPAPRGIIALEKIFDRHDMHKKKKETINLAAI
jgi:hypothetical protein